MSGRVKTWYSIQKVAGTVFARIPKEKAISKRAICLNSSLYLHQNTSRALTTAEALSWSPLRKYFSKAVT